MANGASLCGRCHIEAEQTVLSCTLIREKAGIQRIVLPPHLYDDQNYDKWGNPIMLNGTRLRGELFFDESVQKILNDGGMLGLFTHHVKYPRTYHLPWSLNLTDDDRMMNHNVFEGKEVVVTLKMDGENTTMYRDFVHARSLIFEAHPSRNRVKALHSQIAHDLPEHWRFCGENLYAKHSIKYTDLPSYFLLFSVWNDKNICLPWDETAEWAQLLDLSTVTVLYRGIFDREKIEDAFNPYKDTNEGYVVRMAGSFPFSSFRNSVGKFVRKNHVHTHGHWMRQAIEPNELAVDNKG
jgi:hypothetical protein